MKIKIGSQSVYGLNLTPDSGCVHYSSTLDIIAIKFKCCDLYYACYDCHAALADHPPERWDFKDFQTQAILCGRCGHELTIQDYLTCQSQCPHCKNLFNPHCQRHWSLYFVIN